MQGASLEGRFRKMTLTAAKQTLQVILTFLASTQLSPIFGLDGLNDQLRYTIPLTVVLLVLFVGTLILERRRERIQDYSNHMFAQATNALFEHSMVCYSDSDGMLNFINDKMLAALGRPVDELIGSPEIDLFPEAERPRVSQILRIAASGDPWQGEFRLESATGETIWISATIMPLSNARGDHDGHFIVCTDITKTKEGETHKTIFNSLNALQDQVLLLDADTLAIRYMNRSACIFNAMQDDRGYEGKTVADLRLGYSGQTFREAIAELLSGATSLVELSVNVADREFELRIQAVDSVNQGRQLMIVMIDWTAWKEAEVLRAQFVSDVSHELRTPMTSIKGSVGLILSGGTGEIPDKARRMLEIAHRNADRLLDVVNDLLDLEKIAAGAVPFDFEYVNISALMSEAMAANEGFAQRFGVKFEVEGTETAKFAEVDRGKTIQVLSNLMSNAAKFSKPGGTVDLRLKVEGDQFSIEVEDYGRGIPAAQCSEIFDRFSQAHRDSGNGTRGTGLGLAIVKAIIERQSGSIDVASEVGQGTKFTLTLPVRQKVEAEESTEFSAA